jgi:hypothetical protein
MAKLTLRVITPQLNNVAQERAARDMLPPVPVKDAFVRNIVPSSTMGGTSLQGLFSMRYSDLVALLGPPHYLDDDKTLAEWCFEYEPNGVIFTIYDWKNYGQKKEQISEWHIGGKEDTDLKLIGRGLGVEVQPWRQYYGIS